MLDISAPISVPRTILSSYLDELIESSGKAYQVGTITVIISIFIYRRKIRNKTVSRLVGSQVQWVAQMGWVPRQAGHAASAQRQTDSSTHKILISYCTCSHIHRDPGDCPGQAPCITPWLLPQVGPSLLSSLSKPVPRFPLANSKW